MRKALAFAVALLALPLLAANDPHGKTYAVQCLTCHVTHKAAGQNLTGAISNESLCTSCHNLAGTAARFPMERMRKADPAVGVGSSHAWNVNATNAAAGAKPPLDPEMARRATTNITCSTCHEQHKSLPGGIASGLAGRQTRTTPVQIAGSGTGTVTYTAAADASDKGYLLEIAEVAGNAGTAKFRLSSDGGLSWFGWSGSAWTTYATGNAQLTGAGVPLNDGTKVLATFSGVFAIGDRIRFHVSYPYLRVQLDRGDNVTGTKFCRDCHRDRAMDHNGANTWDGTMRSHPVGVTLNANGMGYDRAAPLDANGLPQGGAGDGNATNDLVLAADQTVQCLSCHGVHHADGNSNTVDVP